MNRNLILLAVIVVAMATFLSPGCFDGPNHQQYQSCNVDVNVVVDNNHVDQHVFTYLVEMVQVEDQTCSCPSGYSLNEEVCTKTTYGTCQNCPYISAVYGPWEAWQNGDCPQGEGSNTCQDEHVAPIIGSWGSWESGKCPGNHDSNTCNQEQFNPPESQPYGWYHQTRTNEDGYDRHHHRTYTAGYYDCGGEEFVACNPPQNNKQRSVTILTTAQTCTCPAGYNHVGDTCEKVVDSETVTSTQSDPAEVHLVYQFDNGWGGFFGSWCWHLKWHDRYGDHDRRFNEFDQDKTYIIRVTDTGDETGYTTGTLSQTFTTDICGGDITFHYTGPFCPEIPCSEGMHCDGAGSCIADTESGGGTLGGESGNGGSGNLGSWGVIFFHTMTTNENTYDVYYWYSSGTTQEFIRVTDPDGIVVRYENVTDTAINQTGDNLPLRWFGYGNYYLDKPKVWTVDLLGIDSESPLPRVLSTDKAYANEIGPDGKPIPQTVRTFIKIW